MIEDKIDDLFHAYDDLRSRVENLSEMVAKFVKHLDASEARAAEEHEWKRQGHAAKAQCDAAYLEDLANAQGHRDRVELVNDSIMMTNERIVEELRIISEKM